MGVRCPHPTQDTPTLSLPPVQAIPFPHCPQGLWKPESFLTACASVPGPEWLPRSSKLLVSCVPSVSPAPLYHSARALLSLHLPTHPLPSLLGLQYLPQQDTSCTTSFALNVTWVLCPHLGYKGVRSGSGQPHDRTGSYKTSHAKARAWELAQGCSGLPGQSP
jgi:hypothetical protein